VLVSIIAAWIIPIFKWLPRANWFAAYENLKNCQRQIGFRKVCSSLIILFLSLRTMCNCYKNVNTFK
jgi:hypothetical protein